jgi:hypothetical protein
MSQDLDNAVASKSQEHTKPAEEKVLVDRFEWLVAVLASKGLTAAAKALAARLFLHMNSETGKCFPKQETLATGLGISREAVNSSVQTLCDHGWLSTTRTRGASHYKFLMRSQDHTRCEETATSDVKAASQLDVKAASQRTVKKNLKRTQKLNTEEADVKAASHLAEGPAVECAFSGIHVAVSKITFEEWQQQFPFLDLTQVLSEADPKLEGVNPSEHRPFLEGYLRDRNNIAEQDASPF